MTEMMMTVVVVGGGGGGGDDDDGGGGRVDMRGLLIPVESLTNPPTIYLPTKSSISTY